MSRGDRLPAPIGGYRTLADQERAQADDARRFRNAPQLSWATAELPPPTPDELAQQAMLDALENASDLRGRGRRMLDNVLAFARETLVREAGIQDWPPPDHEIAAVGPIRALHNEMHRRLAEMVAIADSGAPDTAIDAARDAAAQAVFAAMGAAVQEAQQARARHAEAERAFRQGFNPVGPIWDRLAERGRR